MEVKRITVRVSPQLYTRVARAATRRKISLNRFVAEALERSAQGQEIPEDRWPLGELSALLAPAAEAAELTEEELLAHAREARSRIWRERYRAEVQAVQAEE